jgi:hypothetical protein
MLNVAQAFIVWDKRKPDGGFEPEGARGACKVRNGGGSLAA